MNEQTTHLSALCERVDVEVRWGSPIAEQLIAAAKKFSADLVIATVREHSRLSRMVFSHADWELARLSSVPVLFAHNDSFRPYKNVVAAVDPLHAFDLSTNLDDEMIRAGKRLATPFDGDLTLVNAYPEPGLCVMAEYSPPPELYAGWKKAHKLAVAKLADRHDIDAAHVRLVPGEPKYVIADTLERLDADLVVVGSVSRRHKRRVVGQNSGYIIDNADCDVLVVRAFPSGNLVRSPQHPALTVEQARQSAAAR